MSKEIVFNFWRLAMPKNEKRTFEDLLSEVKEIKDIGQRTTEISGYPIRAEKIQKESQVWISEMIKLRLDELPAKVGLETPIEDLNLKNNEGVGEPNGFLYDPSRRLIVTHGEHFGVSTGKIVTYFSKLTHTKGLIHIEPVFNERSWKEFNELGALKSLTYRIGRDLNTKLLTNASDALLRSLKIMRGYKGLQMDITIGVGRSQKHAIDKEAVEKDISALLACFDEDNSSVGKLTVKGINSETRTRDVDLLEARIRHRTQVDLGAQRRLTFNQRLIHLISAWKANTDEVDRIYSTD